MSIETASAEVSPQMTAVEQCLVLQNHFELFYSLLADSKPVQEACFESKNGIKRCLSGIPVPYHNAILGTPAKENGDSSIEEQLHFFNKAQMPFVWYINESSDPLFKRNLLKRGFKDAGIFRGVIGLLNKPLHALEAQEGVTLEMVEDDESMDEFNDLVCNTFGICGASKYMFKKVLWKASKNENHPMFHWLARKEGVAVSALSTLIEGNVVSFWNGATLPEFRRQGLSTALRCLALQAALARGCHLGASYLMAEGLAYGICSTLGFQTQWKFNAYLSPELPN